jgi:hypothetical protein
VLAPCSVTPRGPTGTSWRPEDTRRSAEPVRAHLSVPRSPPAMGRPSSARRRSSRMGCVSEDAWEAGEVSRGRRSDP